MSTFTRSSFCTALLALSSTVAPMVSAQDEGAPPPIDLGAPVCMVRPLPDMPQVAQTSRGQAFRILVVEAVVPALEAKGYTQVECKTADLVLADKRNGYRDQICRLAANGNEAVQNQNERALGERPAVLCAAAEAAVGEWDRNSS